MMRRKIPATARATRGERAAAQRTVPLQTTSRHAAQKDAAGASTTPASRRVVNHRFDQIAVHANQLQRQEELTPATIVPAGHRYRVFIIGSPSPAEVVAKHPYQFEDAARFHNPDVNTVWIVEQSGYALGGVDQSRIQSDIGKGHLFWLQPGQGVEAILNQFPKGSIGALHVFSHGVPGRVTLRYGWEEKGAANYGMDLQSVKNLQAAPFAADATLRFDSCNTGTQAYVGNLAQEVANATGRPVKAWTGRTSYSAVNKGKAAGAPEVGPSRTDRGPHFGYDLKELASQKLFGRVPVLTTFQPPTPLSGQISSWTSNFDIRANLPESRHFQVPTNGTVRLFTQANFSEIQDKGPWGYSIALRQSVNNWFDKTVPPVADFQLGRDRQNHTWRNLSGGTYYLNIFHQHGVAVTGTVTVQVAKP